MQKARKSTDYILPTETCVMINVIFSSKTRAARLAADATDVVYIYSTAEDLSLQYKYKNKLDETLDLMLKDMDTCIQEKLIGVLEGVLQKLARYDEGNPLGTILSMAVGFLWDTRNSRPFPA